MSLWSLLKAATTIGYPHCWQLFQQHFSITSFSIDKHTPSSVEGRFIHWWNLAKKQLATRLFFFDKKTHASMREPLSDDVPLLWSLSPADLPSYQLPSFDPFFSDLWPFFCPPVVPLPFLVTVFYFFYFFRHWQHLQPSSAEGSNLSKSRAFFFFQCGYARRIKILERQMAWWEIPMYCYSILIYHCLFKRGLGGGPKDALK